MFRTIVSMDIPKSPSTQYRLEVCGIIFLRPGSILLCKCSIRILSGSGTNMTEAIRLLFDSAYIQAKKASNNFFSKHKIQIQSSYSNENLTPDPVGGSRSPDRLKSSPCTPLVQT